MTLHEKITQTIKFIISSGDKRVNELYEKGLSVSNDDDYSDNFYRGENSGNFYMLFKSIFPQAKPYHMESEWVSEGIYAKIGFRYYSINYDCMFARAGNPVFADEGIINRYRKTGNKSDRFREDLIETQKFFKTLPDVGLAEEEELKLKSLRQVGNQVLAEVKPLMDVHCDFEGGACSRMRKRQHARNCCDEYECQYESVKGCLLGDEKPLYCKMFLCETVERNFNTMLENDNQELYARYRNAMDTLNQHDLLLQKEFEVGLTN